MKKTKSWVLVTLVVASTSIFAYSAEERQLQEQENMKMLAAMGLPLPGSGIKIAPRSALNLSQEQLDKGAKEEEELKSKGYVTKYTNRPNELLKFSSIAKKELKLLVKPMSETSTNLRKNVKDIKLAFKFKGIAYNHALRSSSSGNITLLGAVPQGGFHEDKGGWSGVAQYFVDINIGTCSYGVMNVKASNTAAQLAMEDVTYTINHKATLMRTEGSENSGFLYTIEWFDDDNFHELECANLTYSPKINNAVIELANQIDNG